jgi:hypothetical protein
MPVWSEHFPFAFDPRANHSRETPPQLIRLSQPELFLHSVLKIGHPTSYPTRERWIIEQGNAAIAFRSGGYWNVGVLTSAILLGFLFGRRKGWMLLGAIAAMWCFVSVLPQSRELRYYMFLPLTTAAIIGMLLPRIRRPWPEVTFLLLAVFLTEFSWMTNVNLHYYKVEHVDYRTAADFWKISPTWPRLERGGTYCTVGFAPAGFFFTGPTMKEFHIIDAAELAECPKGVKAILKSQ